VIEHNSASEASAVNGHDCRMLVLELPTPIKPDTLLLTTLGAQRLVLGRGPFEKMHSLGLRELKIEERDSDVLVTIRHEALASPEQAIMKYQETHVTIRNKQARQIIHIKDSEQMKRILSTMAKKGEIEGVPGARFGGIAYRTAQKKKKSKS
jgi:hypothetical protein